MRRSYFFVLLGIISFCIIFPELLLGYTHSGEQFRDISFRLFTGLNLSKIRYSWGDPETAVEETQMEPYHKHRMGICAGFGMETWGRLGVVVELLYYQKGDRIHFDDGVDFIKSSITIHEMSVPVFLKLNLCKNTGPYLLAGGEIGFVLTAIERHETYFDVGIYEPDILYSKGSENITKNLKRLNYGIVVGAGLKLIRRNMGFFIELRYHYGLADLAKNEIKDHLNDRMRTNAIVFMIGISTL